MKSHSLNLQAKIFQYLERLKPSIDVIKELSDLLDLSENAIYKRSKGITGLKLEELELIVAHYRLPLERFVESHGTSFAFQFPFIETPIGSYDDYLSHGTRFIEQIRQIKVLERFNISQNIPYKHFFAIDEIIAFKLFVWGHSIWQLEECKSKKIELNLKSSSFQHVKTFRERYQESKSTEIWTPNALHNMIHQINYMVELEKFKSKGDVRKLIDCLRTMIDHVEKMAKVGKLFPLGGQPSQTADEFILYVNDVVSINEVVYFRSSMGDFTSYSYDLPNYASCTDPKFLEYTRNWFEKIISSSTRISGSGERHRTKFFSKLHRNLDDLEGTL